MPVYKNCSDFELTSLLKKGDQAAFAEIYDRYWGILYRHALRMLQDDDTSGDIVQDVFLGLWNKAPDTAIASSLSGFLYAAVRNRILDHWSHERVKEKHIDSLADFAVTPYCTTDFLVREKMLKELINREIAALPDNMRKAFELSRNYDLSYHEIAEKLEVSEHVVRNNISRALKILRMRIGDIAVLLLMINS